MDILLQYAAKYGPELVLSVLDAMKKKGITVQEVEAVFAGVKPFSAFGIDESKATP